MDLLNCVRRVLGFNIAEFSLSWLHLPRLSRRDLTAWAALEVSIIGESPSYKRVFAFSFLFFSF